MRHRGSSIRSSLRDLSVWSAPPTSHGVPNSWIRSCTTRGLASGMICSRPLGKHRPPSRQVLGGFGLLQERRHRAAEVERPGDLFAHQPRQAGGRRAAELKSGSAGSMCRVSISAISAVEQMPKRDGGSLLGYELNRECTKKPLLRSAKLDCEQ